MRIYTKADCVGCAAGAPLCLHTEYLYSKRTTQSTGAFSKARFICIIPPVYNSSLWRSFRVAGKRNTKISIDIYIFLNHHFLMSRVRASLAIRRSTVIINSSHFPAVWASKMKPGTSLHHELHHADIPVKKKNKPKWSECSGSEYSVPRENNVPSTPASHTHTRQRRGEVWGRDFKAYECTVAYLRVNECECARVLCLVPSVVFIINHYIAQCILLLPFITVHISNILSARSRKSTSSMEDRQSVWGERERMQQLS